MIRRCHSSPGTQTDAAAVGPSAPGERAGWCLHKHTRSPLKFVWTGVKPQLGRACPESGAGMPPAGGCCSRSGVTRPPTPADDPASKTRAQTPLLTCAANEQQPPEQLPYLQHNLSDILLDEAGDASPVMRREGADGSLPAGQQLTATGRIFFGPCRYPCPRHSD